MHAVSSSSLGVCPRLGRPLACAPHLRLAPRCNVVQPSRRLQVQCNVAPAPKEAKAASATLLHDPPSTQSPAPPSKQRTRVVVLGSGWGAVSFLKAIDPKMFGEDGPYELILVSPRNYFLYTPLLPSAVSGTVEERSIVEPVRNLIHGKGSYYEAECLSIDPATRTLTCLKDMCEVCRARQGAGHTDEDHKFSVQYDILMLAVGSVNNTFGIKGVKDHAWFLKSVDDAHKLRVHLSKAIEQAGLPSTTPEERRRLLSFVVVGGGPTGCELAAELHDLVKEDVAKLFPHLRDEVTITLIDTLDHLLNAFDRQIAEYAGKLFVREGITLKLSTRVLSVGNGKLLVQPKGRAEETVEFGTCVWATGVAMHPLVASLKSKLPPKLQTSATGLVVDKYLRVKGAGGRILAVGDAAVTNQDKAVEHAAQLFESVEPHHSTEGRLSARQVHDVLMKAKSEYPQVGEMAHQLEDALVTHESTGMWHGARRLNMYTRHIERLQRGLTYSEFRELLEDMDAMLRALPATAQVARQEGAYLAKLFSAGQVRVVKEDKESKDNGAPEEEPGAPPAFEVDLDPAAKPFKYLHMGSLAYLGMDRAVMQLPSTFPFRTLKGWLVGHAWRGLETWMQVSLRNQYMVMNDWIRTKIFGRNLSDV